MVEAQVEIAEALQPAVRAVVGIHLDHGPPVILDGDYLLPGVIDGQDQWDSVRMVVLREQDEDVIAANLARREPGQPDQRTRAHVSRQYGQVPSRRGRPGSPGPRRPALAVTTAPDGGFPTPT